MDRENTNFSCNNTSVNHPKNGWDSSGIQTLFCRMRVTRSEICLGSWPWEIKHNFRYWGGEEVEVFILQKGTAVKDHPEKYIHKNI